MITEQKAKEMIHRWDGLHYDDFKKWMIGKTIQFDKNGKPLYFSTDVNWFIWVNA